MTNLTPDQERWSALFCNDWTCCPREYNEEHPDNPITHQEWTDEQERVAKLLAEDFHRGPR